MARDWPVGLLFGGERAGLETDDIALCQAIVTVPVDPKFRSLNLAQAVAICAYEWRVADDGRAAAAASSAAPPPADQAAMLGLYEQLEGELDAAGFFHPPEKRPSMVRNLRAALGRAAPHRPGGAHLPRRRHRALQGPRPGAGQAGGEEGARRRRIGRQT